MTLDPANPTDAANAPAADASPDAMPDLPDVLAQSCAKFGLNDEEINAVQADVLDAVDGALKADEAARRAERDAILDELRESWGEEARAALEAASFAAQTFGLDDDDVEDLLDCGTPAKIIPALARMGQALRALDAAEPEGEMPGKGGRLTPEAAQQELARLAADSDHRAAFLNRAHPGHAAAKARRAELIAAASDTGGSVLG